MGRGVRSLYPHAFGVAPLRPPYKPLPGHFLFHRIFSYDTLIILRRTFWTHNIAVSLWTHGRYLLTDDAARPVIVLRHILRLFSVHST